MRPARLMGGTLALALVLLTAWWWWPEPPPLCAALSSLDAREVDGRCVVDGDLNTADVKGSQLPVNLTVRGSLRVYGCDLAFLPRGLVVNQDIWLYKACITSLPGDVVVGQNIDADYGWGDTPLPCSGVPEGIKVAGTIRCQ